MSTEREMKKQQEEVLFENVLAQEFLANNKAQELASHLGMTELRLQSGMTAEEIDAVTKRAKEAYARKYR
jgi:hypothetical protein